MTYRLVRKLDNGEVLFLAAYKDVREAKKAAAAMNQHWPGEYAIYAAGREGLEMRRLRAERP